MWWLKRLLLAMPGFTSLCRRLTRRHVRVFMYHRFRDDAGAGEGMRASVFRRQLQVVLAGHAVWTPDQQLRARAGEAVPGACPVVITTDDGYRDYYEVAFPILRELGVPATLFVTTGFVDGSIWLWWDKLRHLGERAPAVVSELEVAGQLVPLDFRGPQQRQQTVRFLINRGRFIADAEKRRMLDRLAAALQVELPAQPPASASAVTWEHIRAMHQAGQVFAPHSVTHPILTRIEPAAVDREIQASRDRLAEILGDAGRVFAYPQGGPSDFDADVSRRVAAAGFAGCYLAYQGPALDDDAFQLPRYCAGECMTTFRWALCGAEFLGNRLRRKLGLAITPGQGYWYGAEPAP